MQRVKSITIIFLILLSLLCIHFFNISMIRHRELSTMASQQRSKKSDIKTWRGCIFDCNMIPLCDRSETTVKTAGGQSVPVTGRYTSDTPAKHLLGYINSEGDGVCGIEKTFNDILKTDLTSSVSYIADINGNQIHDNNLTSNYSLVPDKNIKLTLDYKIQKIAEQVADEFIPSGAIVIMDIQNFDIKAMVSRPDYNQNNITEYMQSKNSPLLNKAVCSYNAGSIFKIITSVCAIENNINIQNFCNGSTIINGIEFGCHQKEGHQLLDFKNAFAKSCNCYYYTVSQILGADKIIDTAKRFNLYKNFETLAIPTDKGFLPDKKFYNNADSANISIGQGEILVTPLQVAYISAVIANKGLGKTVNITDSVVDGDGNIINILRQQGSNYVISKECADKIGEMMRQCVIDGTAKELNNIPVLVAGKTGSAETGWLDESGMPMVHGWFCGYFPYQNPKYAMVVFAENGQSGSSACIPAFKKIVLDINDLYNINTTPEF